MPHCYGCGRSGIELQLRCYAERPICYACYRRFVAREWGEKE